MIKYVNNSPVFKFSSDLSGSKVIFFLVRITGVDSSVPTVQISRNVAPIRTRGFARTWLNNRPKRATQGCILTSKTWCHTPPSAIIKPRANPQVQANAMLRVICTIHQNYSVYWICKNHFQSMCYNISGDTHHWHWSYHPFNF